MLREAMMKKVLVPVDGSPGSIHAAQCASVIAKGDPDTKLLILNVQTAFERRFTHGLNNSSARRELRNRGELETAQIRKALDHCGCCYDFMVVYGRPADVIARTAEAMDCSEIIMGSRGMGPVRRALLGSVGDDVVRATRVPVTRVT